MRFNWVSFSAGIVAGLLLAYVAVWILWWWAHWRVRSQFPTEITDSVEVVEGKPMNGWLNSDGSVTLEDGSHIAAEHVDRPVVERTN